MGDILIGQTVIDITRMERKYIRLRHSQNQSWMSQKVFLEYISRTRCKVLVSSQSTQNFDIAVFVLLAIMSILKVKTTNPLKDENNQHNNIKITSPDTHTHTKKKKKKKNLNAPCCLLLMAFNPF